MTNNVVFIIKRGDQRLHGTPVTDFAQRLGCSGADAEGFDACPIPPKFGLKFLS